MEKNDFIKLVGIITMFIDHIGAILLPQYVILRIIGRIAFPLFCYQAFIGAENTKNIGKYISRLLLFGVVSELVYMQMGSSDLNIMFTMAYGVVAMYLWRMDKHWSKFLAVFLFISSIFIQEIQYSWYGIGIMLGFECLKKSKRNQVIVFIIFTVIYSFFTIGAQVFAVFAIPIILSDIKINIKVPKYFFYIFYPLHLQILLIISYIIT